MKTGWSLIMLLLVTCGAGACKKTPQCGGRTGPAVVTAIHTPRNIATGTDAVITLNIKIPDTVCTQGAIARIEHVNRDTFLIRTEVIYTGPEQSEDCDCSNEATLKSSVTFRTDLRGAFFFLYDREQDMSNSGGDGRFEIIAD